jgi:hypothetical protein
MLTFVREIRWRRKRRVRVALTGVHKIKIMTRSRLQLAPDEVVSVSLLSVGNTGADDNGSFAARALSFRIRLGRIR